MNDGAPGLTQTTTPLVFQSLAIEGFRGFNVRQDFDLSANVVVLRGPNGVGKTSVFDALQWLLVGDIPRLRDSRLRKTEEYILNAYAGSGTAEVSAIITTRDERVAITRTGDRSGSVLSWQPQSGIALRGREAEEALGLAFGATEDVSLETALTAAGLLQQDAARLVLKSSPKDRFTLFSQLLGLATLEKFESWMEQRSKSAAAQLQQTVRRESELRLSLDDLVLRLSRLRDVARARPAVSEVHERLVSALAGHYTGQIGELDRERAAAIASAAAFLAQESGEVGRLGASLPAAPPEGESWDTERSSLLQHLDSLKASLVSVREATTTSEQDLRAVRDSQQQLEQLAAAALPLVRDDRCPVCDQDIESTRLRERLISLGGQSEATEQLSASLAQLRLNGTDLERRIQDVESRLRENEVRRIRDEDATAKRTQFQSRVFALGELRGGFRIKIPPVAGSALVESLLRLSGNLQEVANLARELVVALDAAKSSEEAATEREIASVRDQLEARSQKLEGDARRAAGAKQLSEAARAARVDVVNRQLNTLTPIAQDVYSRMDPHPTFTELHLVSEMFRSAGTTTAQVRDEREEIVADPMLMFSAAQANITAIAYLIALNWAAGGRVPMLLMDDPIQAMDDVNVLGFADLCRHLRTGRQLILSTHERRFADLLERKLAPRRVGDRVLVLEFDGWDRSGPQVKLREVEDQLSAGLARTITDEASMSG